MVTKSVEYAAMLLQAIKKENAEGTKGFKLKDFSEKKELSRYYMEQIGRKLVDAQILGSVRGPGGGYRILPDRVSLYDLISAVSIADRNENTPIGRAVMRALDNIVITKK